MQATSKLKSAQRVDVQDQRSETKDLTRFRMIQMLISLMVQEEA